LISKEKRKKKKKNKEKYRGDTCLFAVAAWAKIINPFLQYFFSAS
jgi:hypothetical protein